MDHADISAITLVYCDQLEPSPPSPSPLFLPSPPRYSPAYGGIPMTEVDLESGILETDTGKMEVDLEAGILKKDTGKMEVDLEAGILKTDTGKMEVDDSEGHLLIFNKALVGSQDLEVLIPVDDVNEKYADHGNPKERIVDENCAFLSRWADIVELYDDSLLKHVASLLGHIMDLESLNDIMSCNASDNFMSCNSDGPDIQALGPCVEDKAGPPPKYASETPEIIYSNDGIDFETEFLSYREWNVDDSGHVMCTGCQCPCSTTCNDGDCSISLCTSNDGDIAAIAPCLVRKDNGPWLCPAHATGVPYKDVINTKLPRDYTRGFRLRPMLYVLIRYEDERPIMFTGISERLHRAFHGHMDLLMEVKIEIPKYNSGAEETMIRWMSNHPSSAVLVVLATNKKPRKRCRLQFKVVRKALGPSYESVLVKNHSPIRGLLILAPGGILEIGKHPSQLKCWRKPVQKAEFTWVVGFTNPNLYLGRIMSSLPEFVSQIYFKTVLGRPNAVSEALIWSFASPWVLDHTGILLIELSSRTSIYPEVREFIRWSPNLPWGIALQPCPICKTDLHLKAIPRSSLECSVKCQGCGSEGSAKSPDELRMVFLKREYLNDGQEPYIFSTFPKPAQVNVEWKTNSNKEMEEMEGYIRHDLLRSESKVTRKFCSSCHSFESVTSCSQSGCTIMLCSDRCLVFESKGTHWFCPLHATTQAKATYKIKTRNYSSLLGSPNPKHLLVVDIPPRGEIGRGNRPFKNTLEGMGLPGFDTFVGGEFLGGESLGRLSAWITERMDADVVVLLRGQIRTSDNDHIFFDLQNALGGLSQVIFNPNRRGGLGIVVLVPGRTTPASLAQFEQLALTKNLSWIITTSHSGFNPGSMVDPLPDLLYHLMMREEGTSIRDLVNRAFNRPWVLDNTDIVFVEYGLNNPKHSLLQLGSRDFSP